MTFQYTPRTANHTGHAIAPASLPVQIREIATRNQSLNLEFLAKNAQSEYIAELAVSNTELLKKEYINVRLPLDIATRTACQALNNHRLNDQGYLRRICFGTLPTLEQDIAGFNAQFFPTLPQTESQLIATEVCRITAHFVLARGTETAVVDFLPCAAYPAFSKHRDCHLLSGDTTTNEFHGAFNLHPSKSSTTFFPKNQLPFSPELGSGTLFSGIQHSSPGGERVGRYSIIITPCSYEGAYSYLQIMQKNAIRALLVSYEFNNQPNVSEIIQSRFSSYLSPFDNMTHPALQEDLYGILTRELMVLYALNDDFRDRFSALSLFLETPKNPDLLSGKR